MSGQSHFQTIALRGGIALCVALVFAVDCLTHRGLAVGVGYIGAVWLAHLEPGRPLLPVAVAAICSVLLITGALFKPEETDLNDVLLNRGLVLTVVWLSAYVSLRINRFQRLLRLNEWRTRTVLESALDAVIAMDERGLVTLWNERATRLFGWERHEALGRALEQLIFPPANRARHLASLQQYLNTGRGPVAGERLELEAMRRDGTVFPIELTITAARDGDAVSFSAFVRDITQWHLEEAQQQRAITEARLLEQTTRAIATAESFEQSLQCCLEALCREAEWPVGHVFLPDSTGRSLVSTDIWYLDAPEEWVDLIQRSRELKYQPNQGLPGKVWQAQTPVWYEDLPRDAIEDVTLPAPIKSGFAFPVVLDGQVVAVLEFFSRETIPRDDALMQLVQRVGERIGEVIEHRRWEEQRARLAAIVDTSYDAIIGKALDGTIISWNRGAERMYGYSEEEALGHTMSLVQCPDAQPDEPQIRDVLATGRIEQLETVRCRKDGRLIPVSLTISPIVDSAGRSIGTATIERDITERQRVETELRKAKEVAEAASRTRSDFLANVSHELRTPINAVLGMTRLALDEHLSESVRDYLTTAHGSAEILLELLNEILDFARLESGRFRIEQQPFQIREVLHDMLQTMATSAAEKALALTSTVDPDIPETLVGDALRVRQILTNLITNGIKFTESGAISLDVRCVRRWPNEAQLEFKVRDTGIGISAHDQQRIFEPFIQGDGSSTRRHGGTGLGLSICSELLHLMGGRLALQSEPGMGSEFSFTLSFPIASSAPCSAATPPDEANPARQRGLHNPVPAKLNVLLAEDTPANQKVVSRVLRKRGHEVTVAENGAEALQQFETSEFDVVLMDVQMPVLDGYRATQAIRQLEREHHREPVPIIALTAHAMRGDRERCLEAGMDAYLAKPVDVTELLSVVESLAVNHDGVPNMNSHDSSHSEACRKPVINIRAALMRLNGDMDLFREFTGFFDEDAPQLFKQIEAAFKLQDAALLSRMAHSLKGLAANLGAEAVVEVAADLERLGRDAELDDVPERLENLRCELQRADQELAQFRR